MRAIIKHDSGTAGTKVLLALVVTLFVIGLIIAIFALMTAGIKDANTVKWAESSATSQTGLAYGLAGGSVLTACNAQREGRAIISAIYNETNTSLAIPATNYTLSGCTITAIAGTLYNDSTITVNYTYNYAGTSYDTINDTMAGIAGTVDWFDIFIVIGAMVVLILLTVMIIISIRGSGIMAGGSSTGAGRNVGSA